MYTLMDPVAVVAAKEFCSRLYYWRQTIWQILIPVAAVIIMNVAGFPEPEPDPPGDGFMNNTVFKPCHHGGAGIDMTVTYEPRNQFTDAVMSRARRLGGFDARAGEMEQDEFSMFNVGVMFKGTDTKNSVIPDSLEYGVFPAANLCLRGRDLLWDNTVYRRSYANGTLNKFLRLIHAVDEGFLQLKNIPTPEMSFQNMYMTGRSPTVHKPFILIAFSLGFSFMVPEVVRTLVQAKRSGVKELVVMTGVKKWHLWAAKLFDCVWLSGTSTLLMVIFLYVPLTKDSRVLTVLPFSVLGWYLCLALFGVFVFLCFTSCLFDSPVMAALATQVVWLASFILFLLMSLYPTEVSFSYWLICCLLPHFSFFTGLSILLDFDYYGKEFNPGEILSVDRNYPTYNDVTSMLIFGIVFYFGLGLYLEEVIPGKFGIPKPYNFLLKKSYWYPSKVKYEDTNPGPEGKVRNVDLEPVPDGTNVGISIRNLRKEYKCLSGGAVAAVDGISIDFYSGEISAILGHNGAGKTSLLSAISGLTHATSGQIVINGYDIGENTDEARRSLGYCPQRDMLFEDLTPFDNLSFFAMAKGLGLRDAPQEAYTLLDKLKLRGAERTSVRKLSRGQKRKLSVGIALIGGSDVVLLDEPTSGLDPEVRREIWEILLSFKGTKTILVTTGSTVEADALSDRIAIMDRGKIKCYGTPKYIKSKYGSGYSLSVVIQDAERAPNRPKNSDFGNPRFPIFFRLRGGYESEDDDRSPGNGLDCSGGVHPRKVHSFLLPFVQFYAIIVKKCMCFSRNIGRYVMFSMVALLFVVASFAVIPAAVKDAGKDAGRPGNFTYSLELYGKSAVPYSIASENGLSRSFAEYLGKHGWETRRVGNVEKELEKLFRDNFHAYTRDTLMAIEFVGDNNKVKIFHNPYAVHVLPLALNALYDSILLAYNVSGEIKTSVSEV